MLEDLQVLYDKGEYFNVCFTILQHEQIRSTGLTDNEIVDLIYLKLRSLLKLNFINEVTTEINFVFYKYPLLSPLYKLKFITLHLLALINQGNFLQATQLIYKGDFELRCINANHSGEDEKTIAHYYHIKGNFYYYKGEFNQAILFFKQALIIRENQQDTQGIGATINNMGTVYQSLGEFDLASKYYLECISLYQSLNDEAGISTVLNNLGYISLQIGDLEEAYNYFSEALKLVKKISNIDQVPDETTGIDYKFLDQLYSNSGNNPLIGDLYDNLGDVLYKRGEIKEALNYFSKALYIFQKINNIAILSYIYLRLVTINLELEIFDQAKYYLKLLDEINTTESKKIQIINKFAHALFFNNEKSFKGKSEAERLFHEIINIENVDWEILVNVRTLLSELLFEEFMFFEDPILLEDAKLNIDKLHTIAKEKKSFSLLTETYILKMKISVVEGDLDKALMFLDQAYLTSSEKNLETLKQKVMAERKRLEKDYLYWKDFLKTSSIKERIEKIEIMDYMAKIKNVINPFKE